MGKKRFMMPVAVHLLLIKDERILLLRRYNTGYEDGNYSVVAGHLDGNETVHTAMIREAQEEAGIEIGVDDLKISGVMHRREDEEERIDYFLTADKWSGEVKNMEPHKCDDLSWCDLDGLPQNIIPYIREAIKNHRENIRFSQFGF